MRGVHTTIAGETDVDDRAIQMTTQNGRVNHAGTRSVRAMSDGGAVEHDQFFAWLQPFKLRTRRHADTVVERQGIVFPSQFNAAIPVGATTALWCGAKHSAILGSRKDMPVPAWPTINKCSFVFLKSLSAC